MSFLNPNKPDDADVVGDDLDRLKDLIEVTNKNDDDGTLTDWEFEFLAGLEERLERYGARTFISPKQWEVIERIEQKIADA